MGDLENHDVILHLGVGAFHRAHQAFYLHRLVQSAGSSWTLAGGNLRDDSEELIRSLADQSGEYTLETVAADGTRRYERIRSIGMVLPWEPRLERIIELGASTQTRIISFTVTEAGYHIRNDGSLDTESADLASDLQGQSLKTLYAAISAILKRRMENNGGPVTLLSCDNLRGNGERFRHGLLEFLSRRGEKELLGWMEANTSCPSSMVDRITPRPAPDLRSRVLAATGFDDAVPVMSESYVQWIIEDHFVASRPQWESVGVQMVESVAPYEEAKIRILNGSHSCIAWAGTLRGHTFIHESIMDPVVRALAHDYISDNVIPCLEPSPLDLAAYRDTVLERFGNPYIADTNSRVCSDSFSKLPGFIVPTIRERLKKGQSIKAASRVTALLFIFLKHYHRGQISYTDQAMDPSVVTSMFKDPEPLRRFCAIPALWGDIAGNHALIAAIQDVHADLVKLLRR